jgi:hypothetical protein
LWLFEVECSALALGDLAPRGAFGHSFVIQNAARSDDIIAR